MIEQQQTIRKEAVAHANNVQDAARKFVKYKTKKAQKAQLRRIFNEAHAFEDAANRYFCAKAHPVSHMRVSRRRPRRGRRSVA